MDDCWMGEYVGRWLMASLSMDKEEEQVTRVTWPLPGMSHYVAHESISQVPCFERAQSLPHPSFLASVCQWQYPKRTE